MKNKEKETVENKNFSKSTLWILGITFFVILVFAFILYIKFRNELKSGAQQNLSDIANQKSEQITQWIQMQYNIGDFFFDNNMFQQRLIDFINNRDNKISEKELRTQFQEICK
jgi:flagellar biosynthesis/type III secretory pathway M-ring protein FliF/YscJ